MVRLAPLNVPLDRRLQTFAVLTLWSMQFACALLAIFLLYWNSVARALMLAYLAWIAIDDLVLKTPRRAGRRIERLRHLRIFSLFRDYFPIRLHKTVDLDPTQRYIFCFHPHGILGFGLFINLATEANGWSTLFPGIKVSVLTLKNVCRIPFSRELLMAVGIRDASKESCEYWLSQDTPGSICLAVGGAQEALDARPHTLKLTLANRYGFIRMALKHGAHVVPVLSFGENDVFDRVDNSQSPTSWVYRLQQLVKRLLGFTTPLPRGRGVFNYSFGLLPYRIPIDTVVGAPLEVPHLPEYTQEDLEHWHNKYLEALQELYTSHRDTYFTNRIEDLVIQ